MVESMFPGVNRREGVLSLMFVASAMNYDGLRWSWILDLYRQGLSLTAIADRAGVDRKTVRKYIERGLEPPVYQPRPPRPTKVAPFERYLVERVTAYPELTASRLLREIRDQGYEGGYTRVKDVLREIRPATPTDYEVRFETPPGRQAQVDFSFFRVVFS